MQVAAARAADVLARADALRRQAHEGVVRWAWAKAGASLHRREPLFAEREHGKTRGVVHDGPPAEPFVQGEAYGFDAAGDVVVCRDPQFGEEVLAHGPDGVERASWDLGGRLRSGSFLLMQGGRAVCAATRLPGGDCDWEVYTYDDGEGRLIEVRAHLEELADGFSYEVEVAVEYDEDGRLARIVETVGGGQSSTIYRRSRTGPSRKAVLAALEDRLVDAVRRQAAAAAGDDELYALVLHYDRDEPLPPTVAPMPVAHRRDARDGGFGLAYAVWNPAEVDGYDPCGPGGHPLLETDPGLAPLVAELAFDDDLPVEGRRLLQRVCRRLNALDGSPWPRTTPDFVVVCVDLELEHLEEDLEQCVLDATLLEDLHARGLLAR